MNPTAQNQKLKTKMNTPTIEEIQSHLTAETREKAPEILSAYKHAEEIGVVLYSLAHDGTFWVSGEEKWMTPAQVMEMSAAE